MTSIYIGLATKTDPTFAFVFDVGCDSDISTVCCVPGDASGYTVAEGVIFVTVPGSPKSRWVNLTQATHVSMGEWCAIVRTSPDYRLDMYVEPGVTIRVAF